MKAICQLKSVLIKCPSIVTCRHYMYMYVYNVNSGIHVPLTQISLFQCLGKSSNKCKIDSHRIKG